MQDCRTQPTDIQPKNHMHTDIDISSTYIDNLLENIEKNRVFEKDGKVMWQCRNCGFIYEGTKAPEVCPACLHPKAYFEVMKTNM